MRDRLQGLPPGSTPPVARRTAAVMRDRVPLLALAGLLVAFGAAGDDLPPLVARGTLRVLVSADEDPAWFSFEGGRTPGFERELLEGFASLHRLRLEAVPVRRFEDIIPDLQRGQGDLIAGLRVTEPRRSQVAFTAEVLPDRLVVVTRRPRPAVRTLEELRAATVGVIPGTSWADAAAGTGVPSSRTVEFTDGNALLSGLKAQRVSAVVMSVSDLLLAARHDHELHGGLALGPPGSTAWGVRRADTALLRALDDYLRNLRRTPSWSRLVVQYFGQDALAVLGRSSGK